MAPALRGLGSRTIGLALCAFAMAALFACGGSSRPELRSPGEVLSTASSQRSSWAGTQPAPEFPPGLDWFNVERPLTLGQLRGKMVLLDFWTLGCINCQHIIPDLKRLEEEFPDTLVVVGVHSGKYDLEHGNDAVAEAVRRYGLGHAVVNDPDLRAWRAFGVNAWPTLVLIDPAGNLVGGHAGEGVYPLFQPILTALLKEFDDTGAVVRGPAAVLPGESRAATILSYPSKVVSDPSTGVLYIADAGHNRILVSGSAGITRVIGTGSEGFADGPAGEARFRQPQGLELSADGHRLYVADTRNHAVRAVDTGTWQVSTLAGTGEQLQRLPGEGSSGTETALASPWDVIERGGRLYISMAGVHQIWTLDLASGQIRVFAGTSREGIDDGDRLRMATLAQPSGLAADDRYLYWVDPESSAIRRVALEGPGEVETLAGTGLFDFGFQDGNRVTARLQHPQGLGLLDGILYVGDTYNHRIRTLDLATGRIGTVAGGERGWRDGPGSDARFAEPTGVSVSGGRVYIADQDNHVIRVLDPVNRTVTTLQLANLGAAAQGKTGRETRVVLPAQRVAPGVSQLRLTVRSPEGHHLNSLGPSRLDLKSANPAVVDLGERTVEWTTDDQEFVAGIPARFETGPGAIIVSGAIYYCRSGAEALCYIHQVEITLPVEISAEAPAGEANIVYDLPSVPG